MKMLTLADSLKNKQKTSTKITIGQTEDFVFLRILLLELIVIRVLLVVHIHRSEWSLEVGLILTRLFDHPE